MAFGYYKSVTIDPTQCGGSNSTNFPVTIWVTDADLKTVGNGGKVQNASGFDIRPYADSGASSALTYELVPGVYTATTGKLEMHVKLPTVSCTVPTVFYLFFGNAALNTDGSSTSTWDASYQGVWHLPNGSSLTLGDSTSHANTGTNSSATAAAAEIDGGASVDGTGQHIVLPFAGITSAQFGTLSLWASMRANVNGFNAIFESADGSRNLALYITGFNGSVTFNGSYPGVSSGTVLTPASALHHLVFATTPDGAGFFTTQTYQDGVFVNNDAGAPFATQNVDFGDNPSGGGTNWDGLYDEIRWSINASAVRSADWILTEYNNQKPSSTFLTWGTLTPVAGGSTPRTSLPLLGVG
jgi:hypothetical protein